jgi:hypothetical protein
MQPEIDYYDPLSTAAAAMQLSSVLAPRIRHELYL